MYCSEGVEAIIPFTGSISNDGPTLHRTEHYGHYWTSTTSSTTNYNGMVNLFDFNNLLLHRNNYQYSKAGTDGVSRYFSRACRGNVVRCEKIK